jgi:hypothetical protein
MTIAAASGQGGSSSGTNNTSISYAYPGNVNAGSLLFVGVGAEKFSADSSAAGDLVKASGTATIDTPVLHAEGTNGSNLYAAAWTVLVTGSGSLTLSVENYPADTVLSMFAHEFTGNWDGSRAEDTDAIYNNAGVAPKSGSVTSAGAALIIGVMRVDGGTPITPDGAFTEVAAATTSVHAIYRIVGSGTSDFVEWTSPSGFSWSIASVVLKEAAGGGSSSARLALLGIG